MSIDQKKFSYVVNKLRTFFLNKGFVEVHTTGKLSILASCEDVQSLATFNYSAQIWPLAQSGQMILEEELLTHPSWNGVFCVSTSFRDEKKPIPGRHDLIFPMFEYEFFGNMDDLRNFEKEILEYLGYPKTNGEYPRGNYLDVCAKYGVEELTHEHETKLYEEFGPVFFLEYFPELTSPFFNMERNEVDPSVRPELQTVKKIDVLLSGVETFGSAERSCNTNDMREKFNTISGGEYRNVLYQKFGKCRVDKELDDFLNLDFSPRVGCGVGLTRLIKSMDKEGLMFI
jgi:aspartyl/asparaginyl-tRNA synthetase